MTSVPAPLGRAISNSIKLYFAAEPRRRGHRDQLDEADAGHLVRHPHRPRQGVLAEDGPPQTRKTKQVISLQSLLIFDCRLQLRNKRV